MTNLEDREKRNGHRSAVIWITGLPASGKSTIARKLEKALFEMGIQVFSLDGDTVRKGLCSDLGFSESDRGENIRRVGEVCKLFAEAGFIVVASFISPYERDRRRVREKIAGGRFVEVFLDCPVEECERRDPKGHYRAAREGRLRGFTGVDAPYERPRDPEIRIDTARCSPEEAVSEIIAYLRRSGILKTNSD